MKEIYFEQIDSTNTYLKDNYEKLDDMCFVRAGHQLKGKGRKGRQWLAERNANLTFSVLIKNEEVISHYKELSVLSAYSITQALKKYGLKDLMIKWPNDVYVRDEKICGILLESVTREKIECLIIGIGINVNQKKFPGIYIVDPTSMSLQLKRDLDLGILKNVVYTQLSENISDLKQGHDFYEEISSLDYLKGRKAQAYLDGQRKEVEIIGIDRDYTLKCQCEGTIRNIESGEISFHQGDC